MHFKVETRGHGDFIDITPEVQKLVNQSAVKDGVALIFVPGSTAAITTIEYEPGVIQDLINVLERIAPENFNYLHHRKWGDHNGAAHIKAALIGPDLSVPVENGSLALGSWQQIVLIDFDERPRQRDVVVKIIKQA